MATQEQLKAIKGNANSSTLSKALASAKSGAVNQPAQVIKNIPKKAKGPDGIRGY